MIFFTLCAACIVAAGPSAATEISGKLESQASPTAVTSASDDARRQSNSGTEIQFYPTEQSVPSLASHAGSIYFEVFINGERTFGVIDTRLEKTIVDDRLVKKAGLITGEQLDPIETKRTTLKPYRAHGVEVDMVGRLKFTADLTASDLSEEAQWRDGPVGLILGRQFLDLFALTLVLPKNYMTISTSDRYVISVENEDALQSVPYINGVVTMTINGRPARLAVDLRQETALELGPAARKRLNVDEGERATISAGRYRSAFDAGSHSDAIGNDIDGSIGLGFFKDTAAVLDGPGKVMKFAGFGNAARGSEN